MLYLDDAAEGKRRETEPGEASPTACHCVAEEELTAKSPLLPRLLVSLQLAASYLTPTLFRQILGRIERLAWHPT